MSEPTIRVIDNAPRLHEASSISIEAGHGRIVVRAIDDDHERVELRFTPTQAWRVTTEDAFAIPAPAEGQVGRLTIVEHSAWLSELVATVRAHHRTATFLDASQHFLLLSREEVVEVIAEQVSWTSKEGTGWYPEPEP
jgi:hypothetical protein